ncbi:TPA: DinI-like family protein [Escherichia coli]|nr:DinI-like family protein [Escherichia coli]
MRVEICIAKEKISKMPKGSVPALQQEMLRQISKRYDDVEVIVKSASNDGLTILRAVDKESAQEFVQETLQNVWETADDSTGLFTD